MSDDAPDPRERRTWVPLALWTSSLLLSGLAVPGMGCCGAGYVLAFGGLGLAAVALLMARGRPRDVVGGVFALLASVAAMASPLLLVAVVGLRAEQLEAQRMAEEAELAAALLEAAAGQAEQGRAIEAVETLDEALELLEDHDGGLRARVEGLRAEQAPLARDARYAAAAPDRGAALAEGEAAARACNDAERLGKAWRGLTRRIRESDELWTRAGSVAGRMEACRGPLLERERAKLARAFRELEREARRAYPPAAEEHMLDEGYDFRIRVSGADADVVSFTWVLMGRVAVHKITGGGSMAPGSLLRDLQDRGFRRVVFHDGFGERRWYDLDPEDRSRVWDRRAGAAVRKLGIAARFRLKPAE